MPRHKDSESGEEQRRTYWIDWKPVAIDAASVLHREDTLGAVAAAIRSGGFRLTYRDAAPTE